MPKKRLLWQLYPSYVIIAMAAVMGAGWLAARWFESFYLAEVRNSLDAAARSAETTIGDSLASASNPKLEQVSRRLAGATGNHVRVVNPRGRILFDSAEPPRGQNTK